MILSARGRALALCAALFGTAAGAHDGPLDTRFGDGGMRNYGFQAVSGSGQTDRAVVACPTASNTVTVVGVASDGRRVVTIRLRANGDYDTDFSDDGKESFELAGEMTPSSFVPGLCQPDGHMVAARSFVVDAGGEQNIQILRVLKTTGKLDPAFGQGGMVILDLDLVQAGLNRAEWPLALNLLDNGEILLSGWADGNGERGFVARLSASGEVLVAKVFVDMPGRPRTISISSAMLAPDGRIWAITEGSFPGSNRITPYRIVLNRNTLEWEETPHAPLSAEGNVYAGAGRRVRNGVLAVPVVVAAERALPGLMLFREAGASFLALPAAELNGEDLSIWSAYGHQGVSVLPGGRVLFGASVSRPNTNPGVGLHFALARIGGNASDDRIDPGFGNAGAQTAAFRPVGPNCTSALVAQGFARMTLWLGEVVVVGDVDASCSNGGAGKDYLVGRIDVDTLFASDFD